MSMNSDRQETSPLEAVSRERLAETIEFITKAARATQPGDIESLLADFSRLVPFASGYVNYYALDENDEAQLTVLASFNDNGWADHCLEHRIYENDIAFEEILARPGEPFEIVGLSRNLRSSATGGRIKVLSEMTRFGYANGCAISRPDLSDSSWSLCLFMFAEPVIPPSDITIIRHTAAHIEDAAIRIHGRPKQKSTLLSVREEEVLHWLKNGKYSPEIGAILGISRRTVDFHVANIIRKLGASNRSHAIALALARENSPDSE